MKKNYLLFAIFVTVLSFIAFYMQRNSQITTSTQKLEDIKQVSYELQLLSQKQSRVLDSLSLESNYDEITSVSKELKRKLDYFSSLIEESEDEKLKDLFEQVKEKSYVYLELTHDLKTDTAVIYNSKAWVLQNYNHYLSKLGTAGIDTKFLEYLFNALNPNEKNVAPRAIDDDIYQAESLRAHIQVIYERQTSLENIREELKRNDILLNIDKIILYTLRKLNKLHNETESIIQILLLSSIFLVLYGLVIYARELLISLEAQRLRNDLQQFVDALNVSAIVSKTDSKGIITYANEKFCEVSGYTQEELIGQPHSIVRHPDMSSEIFTDLWSTIKAKKNFHATIQNRKKNGESYFVDFSIIPLSDIEGEVQEYIALRYEVTDLVNARDTALVAEKAKAEFLSNMSHELRTPLNAIVGFSKILSRSGLREKEQDYIQNIVQSSSNLLGIVNDILDLSKLQSGNFSLDYKAFNVSEKVNMLLATLQALADKGNIQMLRSLEVDKELVLNGDWLRISQIITNLLSNAIKFTPKQKAIFVKLSYVDEILMVSVRDEGIGLSKEAQEKIFEPFVQADGSTTRLYGGTGLGLSIVMSLIEQMQGTITVQSQEGMGSDFKVSIPLKQAQTQREKEEDLRKEEDYKPLRAHVLIAEDNQTNRMLLGVFMEEFGLSYSFAKDGVEAVDMFGAEKFDLVLMDENMPNLNGTAAMRKIHSLYGYEVPVIALTANAMQGDREKFIEAGMSDYVSKPIDDEELYRVIKKHLEA